MADLPFMLRNVTNVTHLRKTLLAKGVQPNSVLYLHYKRTPLRPGHSLQLVTEMLRDFSAYEQLAQLVGTCAVEVRRVTGASVSWEDFVKEAGAVMERTYGMPREEASVVQPEAPAPAPPPAAPPMPPQVEVPETAPSPEEPAEPSAPIPSPVWVPTEEGALGDDIPAVAEEEALPDDVVPEYVAPPQATEPVTVPVGNTTVNAPPFPAPAAKMSRSERREQRRNRQ